MSAFKPDNASLQIKLDAAISEGMAATLLAMSRLMRTRLSQPGSGRKYGKHVASAPGMGPAVRTNLLRASWTIDTVGQWKYGYGLVTKGPINPGSGRGKYTLRYGTRVHYAPYLEYGTARMKERPHARPVVAAVQPKIEKLFAVALRRHLA